MRMSGFLAGVATLCLVLAPWTAFGQEEKAPPPKDSPAKPDGGEPAAKPEGEPQKEPPKAPPAEDTGIAKAGNGTFNLSLAGRRPDAAFKEFFDVSGRAIPLDLGTEGPPVTLSLTGAGYWQAVDGIARESRAYLWGAFVPGGPRIRALPAGREPGVLWAAYSGPLRLSLESVEVRIALGPGSPGDAPLELLAWGLPEPGTRVFLTPGFGPSTGAASVQARDSQGADVAVSEVRLSPAGEGFRLSARMRRPPPEAKALAEVRLALTLELAGEREEVVVADAAGKGGREAAGKAFRVKVEEADARTLCVLVSGEGLEGLPGKRVLEGATSRPEFRVLDAEGKEIAPASTHLERVPEGVRVRLALAREASGPIALHYTGTKGREKRTFEFAFKDVPLP